ncbi:hypothetical protein SAZ10_10225 [Mesorhizobium sp. BAC0120]|uniref:hypothetical protein n=1 Tax=Mesorhizobium sp. BAC0120 TaxID=3090670 RepID=UPI00298BFB4A|nr:hypothetical protein [Mesorhizobium sp. BAC0120]MDW6022138.1 hypothetical protein [Mesorhizobium sp. BAC0120]
MAVSSRLVLMFPGFEPIPVGAHCRRFLREAAKTAPVYGMTLKPSEIATEPAAEARLGMGSFRVSASGDDWATESEIVVYGLGELSESYAARNPVSRLAGGLVALVDFIATGTFFRYLRTGIRYGLFFIFPLLVLAGAAIAAWLGYLLGTSFFTVAPHMAGWLLAAIGFLLVLACATRKLHFLLVMDDWAFARDLARGRRPDIEARFALLSADVSRRVGATKAEEILFCGHSFGAIAAIMALADGLKVTEATDRAGLLTVGSSLLKIALHPAAKRLGSAVKSIVVADRPWLDVQSVTDILNFYGTNPAELVAGQAGPNQNTTKVRFRNQMEPANYHAIRRDFFRVHRQFVFAVERRSHYSYHAILCGPQPFADIARRGGLTEEWSGVAAPAQVQAK